MPPGASDDVGVLGVRREEMENSNFVEEIVQRSVNIPKYILS